MMRKILSVLLVAILTAVTAPAENKAYVSLSDTKLVNTDTGVGRSELATIEKGDTLFANEETAAYIAANEGERIMYLPVTHKGIKGFVDYAQVYPVKTSPDDRLVFVHDSSIKNRGMEERFLVRQMEWAMNATPGHMTLLYLIFVALAVGMVAYAVSSKIERFASAGLVTTAVALMVTAGAEIMYILSFYQNMLWFVSPSKCGGWWHTILNLVLMGAVFATQFVLFALVWVKSFWRKTAVTGKAAKSADGEVEYAPMWLSMCVFLPLAAGVILLILMWVNYFMDGRLPGMAYVLCFATMLVPAVIGMIWQFTKKRWADGVFYALLYVVCGSGIAYSIMILGMLFIAIAIIAGFIACALGIALGALGVMNNMGESVRIVDKFGHTVGYGTRDVFGTVKDEDGNTCV